MNTQKILISLLGFLKRLPKIIKINVRKIVSYTILILYIITIGFVFYLQGTRIDFKQEIVNVATRQTDRTVLGIAQCANDEILEGKEIKHALYDCGTSHRAFGDTGDFFAVDIIAKKMLVDNSPDCMKNGINRSFDEKGECSMHSDPERCKEAIKDIYNLKDHTWWKFDNSVEHISCAYIPTKQSGFKGMLGIDGVKDTDNIQIAVCMGMQDDELSKEFGNIIKNNEVTANILTIMCAIVGFTALFAIINLNSKD